MSTALRSPMQDNRRKRVRKGTRSCWECRRRKVKCRYESEDHSICVGCEEKGTSCVSQEFEDRPQQDVESSALGQRLERVEVLLEKFMEIVSRGAEDHNRSHRPMKIVTPLSTLATPNSSGPPMLSAFNDAWKQSTHSTASISSPHSSLVSGYNDHRSAGGQPPMGKLERLQQQLSELLPCQEDVDFLLEVSHGWWLIGRHMMPHLLSPHKFDAENPFDVSAVSKGHPMGIARLLLCLAICIQQLPPRLDLRRLRATVSLQEMMERNITFVTTMLTCHDDLASTTEGVECLILQGTYQGNAGSLRKAWLTFRRTTNMAQLMGLHRSLSKSHWAVPDPKEKKRRYLWYHIVQAERYLSLILGVPSATSSTPTPIDNQTASFSKEDLYHQSLCAISGLILTRNQGDSTHAFSITQELDEKLDALAKRMPQDWWEIPTVKMASRTEEAASEFERMMCQIWHFELATLLHLPFMLRAATDRRYEYSRISCLSSNRGLIKRWMSIREIPDKTLFSNLVEFQAFTAATTILLGVLGPTYTAMDQNALRERHEDLQLVETVVMTLEILKEQGAAVHIADQSISVIRILQGIIGHNGNSSGNLRLEIPYFGTVSITRSGTVHSLEGERILGANPQPSTPNAGVSEPPRARDVESSYPPSPTGRTERHGNSNIGGYDGGENVMGVNATSLHFTSSHFPALETSSVDDMIDWSLPESDTVFFDSLINADGEAGWSF